MRAMACLLVLILTLIVGSRGELFTDEANARLPPLFHLDDYDRCLYQEDGLYCLGVFDLLPIHPSLVYEYIKEYSSSPFAFNRSHLHRGYCVSNRCPSSERNASLRFERCVSERAKRYALSARLSKLNYCITKEQHKAKLEELPDSAQQLFLQVVYAVLALNLVGTVYDFATGERKDKIELLTAWSVRASWRRLHATYDDGDPRLKQLEPIQGMRVVAMLLTMYAHSNIYLFQNYITTPNYVENLLYEVDGVLLANGSSLIQMYLIISAFLTAYSMLLYSQKHQLTFKLLPVLLYRRVIRIAPVHLLIVGYTATWWPPPRSSALTPILVDNNAICRRHFWSHAFFINYMSGSGEICLMPTWSLIVDMHLYILSCALTIIMHSRRQQVLRLYGSLFIITTVASVVVNYCTGWQAVIYFSVPEKIRGYFIGVESFWQYYVSTWGSLQACFMGLFIAHLHYELQEKKYDCNQNKWLKLGHQWFFPVIITWVIWSGSHVRHYKHRIVTALFLGTDRSIICLLMFFLLFGVINIDGPLRRFFGWRGWNLAARLSLPVMLCHWLINAAISTRPVAYHASMFYLIIDYAGTVFYSYLIAIPIAVLVEIPVQRFFGQLIKV